MPTLATTDFQPPESDDEFDEIVADALKLRFGNTQLVRFGRSGQRQHGIDGLDPTVPVGQSIVWQATLQQQNLLTKVTDDLAAFDAAFSEQPKLFVAAFGRARRDADLQLRLLDLSTSRGARGKCPVLSLFWTDIRADLCLDDRVVRKHYPASFVTAPSPSSAVSRQESYRPTLARFFAEHKTSIWFVNRMKYVHQPSGRRVDFRKVPGLQHADLISVPSAGPIGVKMRPLNYYDRGYLVQTGVHELQISVDNLTQEPCLQNPTEFVNLSLGTDLILENGVWVPDSP